MPTAKQTARFFLLVLPLFLLTACGQKGALYLPKEVQKTLEKA